MKQPISVALTFIFLALVCVPTNKVFAQSISPKIIFATKIDSAGNFSSVHTPPLPYPIDPIKGSSLFLIFRANQPIPKPKIYIFIDKKENNNQYKEFDNQRISIENDSTPTAYGSYLFTKEGSYKITMADAEKKEIVSSFLTIIFKTNVVFSEQIDDNDLPLDCKSEFELGTEKNVAIYSFLKLSRPMNCTDIFHQIYHYNGKDYSTLVVNDKFAVKPEWEYTYLKAKYEQKGKYKVVIKTNTNLILGTNYLEIK